MKKILILVLALTLLISCVKSLQPVATLDELATKEELEKKRSWFKQSHARNTTGAAMGATLVLFPVAMIIAFTPNEKDLTINEIADVAAVKTYDYDSTLFLEWIAYTDGQCQLTIGLLEEAKAIKMQMALNLSALSTGIKIKTRSITKDGSLKRWKTQVTGIGECPC